MTYPSSNTWTLALSADKELIMMLEALNNLQCGNETVQPDYVCKMVQ